MILWVHRLKRQVGKGLSQGFTGKVSFEEVFELRGGCIPQVSGRQFQKNGSVLFEGLEDLWTAKRDGAGRAKATSRSAGSE